jgi:hypothetical protein
MQLQISFRLFRLTTPLYATDYSGPSDGDDTTELSEETGEDATNYGGVGITINVGKIVFVRDVVPNSCFPYLVSTRIFIPKAYCPVL